MVLSTLTRSKNHHQLSYTKERMCIQKIKETTIFQKANHLPAISAEQLVDKETKKWLMR